MCCNMPYDDKKCKAEYYQNNKEAIDKKTYEWRKNNHDRYMKNKTICRWKNKGLVSDNYDSIYERYINTTECDCCKKHIQEGRGKRVMDHCHKTGKFRNVLCHNCNILRFHLDNNYEAYLRMMTL